MPASCAAASDVWSLGATVYHALTGQPPYEVGDNVLGALYRIVHEDPPRPPQPGWLRPLFEGTMTGQAQDRWSAAQVRDFLRAGPPRHRGVPAAATVPRSPAPRTAPVAVAAEQGTQVLTPAPLAPVAPATHRAGRTPWGLVALGAVVVLLASLIAFAVAKDLGRGDDGQQGRRGSGSGSATGEPSGSAHTPTAKGMEDFIATYLDTVVSDPEAAFGMLTPAFQEASGGLEGYLGFWDDVTSTSLDSVEADPDALTVSYHYRFEKKGQGPSEDDVTLQLEQTEDGGYLIAGEA